MNQPSYIFNKSEDQPERDRLKLIERYHDPRTRLQRAGISSRGTCLEVGSRRGVHHAMDGPNCGSPRACDGL